MSEAPTILIADDDEGHTFLIRENLALAGHDPLIECFCDGQAILDFFLSPVAPRRAQHGRPYLLLLDINMPKVDGIEVLRRLKNHEQLKKLPVYMLTTSDDERTVERCHLFGCSAYFRKPGDFDEFEQVIRHLADMIPHGRYPMFVAG